MTSLMVHTSPRGASLPRIDVDMVGSTLEPASGDTLTHAASLTELYPHGIRLPPLVMTSLKLPPPPVIQDSGGYNDSGVFTEKGQSSHHTSGDDAVDNTGPHAAQPSGTELAKTDVDSNRLASLPTYGSYDQEATEDKAPTASSMAPALLTASADKEPDVGDTRGETQGRDDIEEAVNNALRDTIEGPMSDAMPLWAALDAVTFALPHHNVMGHPAHTRALHRIADFFGTVLSCDPTYHEWLCNRFAIGEDRLHDIAEKARVEKTTGVVMEEWETYERHIHTDGSDKFSWVPPPCRRYLTDGHCSGYSIFPYTAQMSYTQGYRPSCKYLHVSAAALRQMRRARRHRSRHGVARRHWCVDHLVGPCGAGSRCPHPHLDDGDVREVARALFFTAAAANEANPGAQSSTDLR